MAISNFNFGLQSADANTGVRIDPRRRGVQPFIAGDIEAEPLEDAFKPWSPDGLLGQAWSLADIELADRKLSDLESEDSLPRAIALSPVEAASIAAVSPDISVNALDAAFALPAGTDAEITFLSGVTSAGRIAATSFHTWRYDTPATYTPTYSGTQKWGSSAIGSAGGTLSYWFDPAANWTATEKSVFVSAMALWASVANVSFAEATSAAASSFSLKRGTDGSAYQTNAGTASTIGMTTAGSITSGASAYISIDTSVTGFGPLNGSFETTGGYAWGTVIHELGHLLGLGHGGAYNGSVNAMTQQFSAFDTKLWSTMSYIGPTTTAQYSASYPVTGVNWGYSSDFYGRTPTTFMPLDILAIQRLYGAAAGGPLAGGQTYGFNTNIAAPIRNFFDFTINAHPVITIYNSGRSNTIDASGFTTANTINLVDGTFSSLNGQQKNVAIALGTVIETAIGGSSIDTLNGNAYNNILRGNAGTDFLDGAEGVDTAAYNVTRAAATISRLTNGSVQIAAGIDGTDSLTNMEWAQFTDGKIWIGAQHGDINGDNRSDLFLQSATGMPAIWQMNNGIFSSGATLPNPGADWRLVGSGDFNGDRKADLLWQRISTGELAQWQMSGSTVLANPTLPSPGASWKLIGSADLNNDGKSDMAWQRSNGEIAVWTMDGGTILGAAVLAINPGMAWHLHSAADFNADGSADLLFQHDDGTIATWEMNGTTFLSGNNLGNPGAAWRVKGTGDLNKDGRADIVMQHTNGTVAVWSMQSAAAALAGPTTGNVASPGAAWQVGSIGDYNADGNADIALQSSLTGQISIWSMNGANLAPSAAVLAQNPGTNWHLVI